MIQQLSRWGLVFLAGVVLLTAVPLHAQENEILPIGAIQGDGEKSPFKDKEVSFRGVVTGMYADYSTTSDVIYYTVFVQDLPGDEDGDPATSDGIPLFMGSRPPTLKIGDQVLVTGKVTEYYGLTELDDGGLDIIVEAQDVPLPDPVAIDPPATADDVEAYFEPYEGMLVTLEGEARVVGPTFYGCSFAVVAADSGVERIQRRRLEDSIAQIIPILHTTDVECGDFPNLKSGDLVEGIVGPLTYSFDQFRIAQQDTAVLEITEAPLAAPPSPPTLAEGQFSIATYNVENYFDAIDDTGDDAEPKPTVEEIANKRAKISYALSHTLGCPTLVGIQEVENADLLMALAEETAVACGFTYEVTHYESADGRGIDVALLSDPNRVVVRESSLQQTCTRLDTDIKDDSVDCKGLEEPLFSRPPLLVALEIDGNPYTIIVNHFKSKRGGDEETTPRRIMQARHINALVAERVAADEEAKIIVIGDFNDYAESPALLEMDASLTNMMTLVPDDLRYSYNFSGAAQLLDNMLVSPALEQDVESVIIQHVNADFPSSWGEDSSPEMMAYRSTDHDLPLMVVNLTEEETVEEMAEPTAVPSVPAATEEPVETLEEEAAAPTATAVAQPTSAAKEESTTPNWVWLIGGMAAGVVFVLLQKKRKG